MPRQAERPALTICRLGVVVHPTRDVGRAFAGVTAWATAHGAEVVQVGVHGVRRDVATQADDARGCDLVVAIGGDGTVLAAVRAAAAAGAPVLGVACGSLGALTAVDPGGVTSALDGLVASPWRGLDLPALVVTPGEGEQRLAFNDLVVVRAAGSQVTVECDVDSALFARWAGDGVVVATQLGSSAYTLALGGPLLAPGTEAVVVTPLAPHGGAVPQLVVPDGTSLELRIDPGHGGARVELDGRPAQLDVAVLRLAQRPGAAVLVRPAAGEHVLSGLRRRGLITDSPRLLARDGRRAAAERDRPA